MGYARVSTAEQDLEVQRRRLRDEAGAIRVFENVASGKSFERPGLFDLLDYARPGARSTRRASPMRLTPWVGSLAPGRYADVVLLSALSSIDIAEVWADGAQVSKAKHYVGATPAIDWPGWARQTIRIGRAQQASDSAVKAEPGREAMQAAVLRPFHWADAFLTETLAVANEEVQRDEARNITKFALVDRFSEGSQLSRIFWRGCGPRDSDTALGCLVAHDMHDIRIRGSDRPTRRRPKWSIRSRRSKVVAG